MDHDARGTGLPRRSRSGDGAPTEPIPKITARPDFRWDPDWDAHWWDPVGDAPDPFGVMTAAPGTVAASPAAAPPVTAGRPGAGTADARPRTDPSWGQVLATTVSLWAARRRPAGQGHDPERPGPEPGLPGRRSPGQPAPPRGAPGRGGLLRRPPRLAAALLAAGLLAVAAGTAGLVDAALAPANPWASARPTLVPVPPGQAVAPVKLATAKRTPRPVSLTIPAIGVRTSVITLGLNPDGTLQVPPNTVQVGWYTGSPRPGAVGSAIIAGHVDSRAGPGVFFFLRRLRPGERVYVGRADGTMAVFTVTSVRMYAKQQFPTAAVYGPVPDAELRLITCGGTFDYATGSYLSNVVVYARLTG